MSVYEVEKIVGHKYIKDELYYRVKWMGYSQIQDCHYANLDNCQLLINDYIKQNNLTTLPTHRGEKKKEAKQCSTSEKNIDEPDFISYPFIMIETEKKELTFNEYHKNQEIPKLPRSFDNDPIMLGKVLNDKTFLSNTKYGDVEIKTDTFKLLFG